MKNDHDHDEKKTGFGRGVTRRKFLKTMGSGAAIAAASDTLTGRGAAEAEVIKPEGGPEDCIEEAIESCPVECISWEED